MQKITPFLWFENQAEEAVDFYVSIFKDAKKLIESHDAEGSPRPAGSVMVVPFELFGQKFIALNGGPMYRFTPAVSFVVNCETQDEVDYYWDKLLEGGEAQQCGWLTDKYGLSWQITPTILGELMANADPDKAQRVMGAMMQMVKLDIEGLKNA